MRNSDTPTVVLVAMYYSYIWRIIIISYYNNIIIHAVAAMELVSLQGCNIVLIVIGILALVIEAAMSAVLGTILIVRASLQGKHVPKSTLGEPL